MTITASASAAVLDAADFTDPRLHVRADLHQIWRGMRDERPLYRVPDTAERCGYWVVSRYDDALAIYRDDERFTSEQGNVLLTLLAGRDPAAGKMAAVTDGLRHREVRNVLLKSFSPRQLGPVIEAMRARTRRLLAEAFARAADGATVEFATEVAEHIPLATICDLLGVPESDRPQLLRLSKTAFSSDDEAAQGLAGVLARHEVLLYFSGLADARRSAPGDDVISALVSARAGGAPLSAEEVIYNCYSLILGGEETSRLAMIGAVEAFAANPAQWRALRDGDVDVASAVEEVLRWTAPSMHFGRRAVTDVPLGGALIPAGDAVTLWNISANRDERVFAAPDVFDLARTPNKHLTFGYGPHFCVGAFLARAELTAVVEGLRTAVGDLRLAAPPRRIYSNFLSGYCQLPVAFDINRAGLSALSGASVPALPS
jgi:cytochrome P450